MSAQVPSLSHGVQHRGIITICAMVATLMQALDSTIANVALPYIQSSLAATADQVTWVLTSYIVAAAIMTAPVGWLSARFGRKPLFLVCLIGFTGASMLCGAAQTLTQMVIFRLLQGVFGAALVPLSQATMLDIYPPEQRGQAMALWGMGVMVGPILGPTLGGYLTEYYNWRWVFYINLPFGAAAVAGLVLFLHDGGRNVFLKFDWLGFGVLSLGIGALQMMLDRGELLGWFGSTEIIVETVLAGLGLYLFTVHLFTAERPFVQPRMFKDTNYTAGFFVMFAVGMVLLSSSALMAPWLQTLAGYPVFSAGILMAPRGFGVLFGMMICGRLGNRVDQRLVMLLGILLIAYSLWDMAGWTPSVNARTLVVTTVVQGLGLGFVFIPLQVLAFATLPGELRPDGTAFFSLIRNVGSAIGISLTSFLLSQNTQILHEEIAAGLTPFNRMLQQGGAFGFWNITVPAGLAALNQEVTRQARIIAYMNDFRFMLWITLPTVLLLPLMRRPRHQPKAQKSEEHAAVLD